jgi:hypothetical protein
LCTLLALLLGGAPQPGPRTLPTTIQDDAVLLHGSDASVRQAINQIASLGAGYVRLTASWSAIAPAPDAQRMPGAPFDPSSSQTYPYLGFHDLDRAVADATRAGLKVMIDIAFWAPRWAVGRDAPNHQYNYAPDPTRYGEFAHAVATRYSGRFPSRSPLPAVRLYTVWNEPNNAAFLQPQWRRSADGGWIPESPHIYRRLYQAAYPQIKGAGATNQVLIGATSAFGSTVPGRGSVEPIEFVRDLACVDELLLPLQVPECQGYQPLRADGFSHHPYSLHTTPAAHSPDPGAVPLADLPRLESLLGLLSLTGRFRTDFPVYVTEYGYFTDPPDPFAPFTPEDQARFIGWSTYMAWSDPNMRMFAQFLLRDSQTGPGRPGTPSHWSLYQTGLYYHDGQPKPAAEAFRLPFWVQPIVGLGPPRVLLFGQVRAAHGTPQVVQVERLSPGGQAWLPVPVFTPSCAAQDQFLTNKAGYLLTAAASGGSTMFRLAWRRPGGGWEYGPPISSVDAPPIPITGTQVQPRTPLW